MNGAGRAPVSGGSDRAADALAVGDEIELDIGPVAHGGVCVARVGGAGGRVLFVRYALPGERAVVRVTELKPGSFGRAEAVRVVRADPQRVPPGCAHFGPGGCGGCDFQHVSGSRQRELKAAVVAEQFRRLAGLDVPVTVESLPGGEWGWRSRVRWAVATADDGDDAVLGPRRFRSHQPVRVTATAPCPIAAPALNDAVAGLRPAAGADEVVLTRRVAGGAVAVWTRRGREIRPSGARQVTEEVAGRRFRVAPTGFWQPHEHAAQVLIGAVRDALAGVPLLGAGAWDLYGGVGLFAAVLAGLTGAGGRVVTVESDAAASRLAAANLSDLPQVRAVAGPVARVLPALPDAVAAVVLDPPRSGAGRQVCELVAGRSPSAVVYVACDPAALARDTATLHDLGYRLDLLRAFDAFPQTHHVECVARFVPA